MGAPHSASAHSLIESAFAEEGRVDPKAAWKVPPLKKKRNDMMRTVSY
jgi:hypothetical protein